MMPVRCEPSLPVVRVAEIPREQAAQRWLDRGPHREQLLQTARRIQPRLLLLDPLVRLHGLDENHATEVAGLLAYFRSLQRRLDLSVKNERLGEALESLKQAGQLRRTSAGWSRVD